MEYLSNLQLIQSLARQIVQDRRCNYSQQSLHTFMFNRSHISHKNIAITNNRNQTLLGSLFKSNKNKNSCINPCIIYLHALGSNRLEAIHILDYVSEYYDVMSFDFSGSGKSQGQYTTFGLWEKEDIHFVIEYLSSKEQYQNYIIWGRSMGAVSGALYLNKYPSNSIKCLILDSAFSSFQKTALELACGKSSLPQFMLNACMIPLKKCFKQNYPFDPFEIDLKNKMKSINCKIVLVYSEKDTVVNSSNSKIISQCCLRSPDIIQIQEDHNVYRKGQTYNQIVKIIRDAFIVQRRSRSRGIRLYSNSKDKKGIQLSRCGSRLRTQEYSQKRLSLNGRRNSIFSSIQTQTDIFDNSRKTKKICILPMFYQSQLLMLNSHKQIQKGRFKVIKKQKDNSQQKQKQKQKEKVKEKQKIQDQRQNKQNSKFADNLISKIHINVLRKNRFGLK